jgi:acetyl-CoA carboxylase biotin carboxyl carrier protein
MAQREEVAALIATIDRLEQLLERSALSELELEAGGTTVILRTVAAVTPPAATASAAPSGNALEPGLEDEAPRDEPVEARGAHAIVAPLTGVFYRSPSPGAEAYVREGGQVNPGQVIGLIEAMKLFNEIKSDVAGIVKRMDVGDGDLVKAKQILIEVDPT